MADRSVYVRARTETVRSSLARLPGPDAFESLADALVAKRGNAFLVTRPDGSIPAGSPFGVYVDDVRHLSAHAVTLDGAPLQGVSAAETADGASIELTGGVALERRLDPSGGLVEELRLPAAGELAVTVAADFATMFAVRGITAPPEPPPRPERHPDGLAFHARERATRVRADPSPERIDPDGTLRFAGVRAVRLTYAFTPAPERPATGAFAATLTVDEPRTQGLLERSFADLRALRSRLEGRDYLSAGVPWYATLFGRDSLITALQVLPFAPDLAADTLRLLGAHLGRRTDPVREEEPGKVLHELRPTATESPLGRYYGTVDATPLWLILLAEHARWAGPALLEELRPQAEAALAWLGDGLLTYAASSPDGLRNQGWKDSTDGICHADGTPLEPPIALVEAQGYAIRAKRAHGHDASTLEDALERFWLPDDGYYALALAGDGRASRALASNQGHLLWAGVLSPARAAAVRDAVTGPAMASGWGIRTLAAGQAAYDPLSYHRGSVWPHDTALTAAGLKAHGFDDAFAAVLDALLDAAAGFPDHRLPELYAGDARGTDPAPRPYPVACRPQAWAAGTLPYLVTAGLGLEPDAASGRLTVRRPLLPRGVSRADVRGLRLGDALIDLTVERTDDGRATLADARVTGAAAVVEGS